MLESELFGHERGAFTGAVATRKGRFEMADGGTLFLDEIGDLPPSAQVKLLRFLQERTFERVGGGKTFKVDVRIISATHRDLPGRVAQGAFREDLFYRLRVVRIHVPPLRERPGDIDALIDHFLRHYGDIHHRPIERMVVMVRDNQIGMEAVPEHILTHARTDGGAESEGIMANLERQAIADALRKTGGNKVEAAKIPGIGLRTLYRKFEKWRL